MSPHTAPDPRSDAVLLDAHVAGDAAAFAILYRRHYPRMLATARRYGANPEDADDAVSEAVARAIGTAATFQHRAQVATWLQRIVINSTLNTLRRNANHKTMPLCADHPRVPLTVDPIAPADLRVSLEGLLDSLTPDQRAAVTAVDLEGLSVAQAAARLGVAHGTIKSRCARARAILRTAAGELGPDLRAA